jgi:hypothetical protein
MASKSVREEQSPERATRRPPACGPAEIGVAAVLVALALTALTGTGLPLPTLTVADAMVWVPESSRGAVALVDPGSGRVEARVAIGEPGDDLEVAQLTGRVAVTNHTAGEVLMLDAGTLAVTGGRETPGGAVRLLLTGAGAFLVELDRGTVRRVDSSTVDDIGRPLELGRPIVDVTAGVDGTLSLLLSGAALRGLRWSEQAGALEEAAPAAPVALADTNRSAVVLFSDGTLGGRPGGAGVIEVPVGGAGCARPWRPAIVGTVAYVSCQDAGQVLVLTLGGQASGPPIDLPGSPQPVGFDGGILLVADAQAVLVPAGGAARSLRLFDPGVEVRAPAGVR